MAGQTDTPRGRVETAVREHGEPVVARWAADVLLGRDQADEPGPDLPLHVLGGAHADALVAAGTVRSEVHGYWPRVWGARALLYAWDDAAAPAVVAGLGDPAWRVREMSAKVARHREVGEAAELLAGLTGDETPRVRVAALRGLAVVGEAEQADAMHDAEDDADEAVRRAARSAITALRRRLDREV